MNKVTIVKDAAEKAMTAESERTRRLFARAEKSIAGIIVVVGFQLLDFTTLLESSSPWVKISSCLALAVLSLALFFSFSGLRLKGYADYPRGDKLWENLKSEEVSDEAAELAVIQLVLKTRELNAKLNDAKARSLAWCGWLFFAGFLLAIGSHVLDAFENM
jgi:hypothetical protein